MSSPRRSAPLSRREFLTRMAALSTAAWASPLWMPNYRQALAATQAEAAFPEGTTLEQSIITTGEGPYFRLTYGPPWPLEVRTELAEPQLGRTDRRTAIATILHFTDFQFADVQSPGRFEWMDRYAEEPYPSTLSSAFRAHESLVMHACEAVIRRANAIGRGPITGRPYDCCVSTGDNFDNKQFNELMWFLRLMGGRPGLAANSGAPDSFEGVQSFNDFEHYDLHYYHPDPVDDPRGPDNYKRFFGFPDYPGLLDAAIRPFDPEGIRAPWFSVYGNHDALIQGNAPHNPFWEAIATGPLKVLHPPPGWSASDFWRGLMEQNPAAIAAFHVAPARQVTPDADRRLITGREYVERHREDVYGQGPPGHGFTERNEADATLYYTFELAPGVLGITLDTTMPWYAGGAIGASQLEWLEEQLIGAHSRYLDPDGTQVRTGNDDRLVVVFSHHRVESMIFPVQSPDEEGRTERRFPGDAIEEMLHRFPNVIAWVNGHSHFNRIVPRVAPANRGGFWDITSAAQVDAPQQARIIEIVDNRDGTLSIFTTVIDHASPASPAGSSSYSLLDLASISRELAYNDYQKDLMHHIGEAHDINTELLITAPFQLTTDPPVAEEPVGETEPDTLVEAVLPETGAGSTSVGVGLTAATAALGAIVALRRRGDAEGREGTDRTDRIR